MEEGRVAPGPATARGRRITIRLNGRPIPAYEGDTVGAALHAAGERVLMRSIKYHRPRGLFCCTGKCANCMMRVDGAPNVRACVTPARDGMVVETQNAFPSARRDLFGLIDKAYPKMLDVHTQFAKLPLLRPIHHGVVRRMAGFGTLPDARPLAPRRPPIRRRIVDVLVVGAGPAGLSAAIAAAEGAASVLLVDEADRAGGSLLHTSDAGDGRHGIHHADDMLARLHDAGGEVLTQSTALGVYLTDGRGEALAPPGLVAVLTPEGIVEARARSLLVATGHHETPALFANNDLPGVMGARAALILLHRHGVLAGARVVCATPAPLAKRAADDLAKAGAQVVGIVGEGAWEGARLVEAHGGARVEGVTLQRGGETWREKADLVLCAGDETPRAELLQQAGVPLSPLGFALGPRADAQGATAVAGVFAAGEVRGAATLAELVAQGARAGEAAARHARAEARP